ncbi:YbeF family transcriptional regulator [Cedecea davisae]|uniref:YbeF family transcriptional regulator n=1 Tax=Cedecea davisae TaxID=158484 RepID=UPI001D09BD3C|nr:YbeF family transcriptional regulator [Cedecea davisae]
MGQNPLAEKKIMDRDSENNYPVFKALRNIDLNLLTIFEAVYIHKGIVNAAKVLNLTPSAISQSIQKLRYIFPDPLFIRKGQGVTPTAYAAHLHEYISQGLESILGALDFNSSNDQQRTITLATQPSIGALVIPKVYSAIRKVNPNLLIRNVPINDGESQLSQFQTDLIIDTGRHYARTITSIPLYQESIAVVCREGHPCLEKRLTLEDMQDMEHTFLIMQDDLLRDLRLQISERLPNRQIAFSSYNYVTLSSLLGSSDLLGFMPWRLYEMFKDTWNLRAVDCDLFSDKTMETSMHFNKLSIRDTVLQDIIKAIRNEFAA